MSVSSVRAFRVAALLGFLAVALGAFGAHGLKELFAQRAGAQGWWEKAVLYQFVHVIVMLLLSCLHPFRLIPSLLFGVGIALFSGSLYLYTLTGISGFAHVTPVGGVCFLAGWLTLMIARRAPAGIA